MLTVDFASVIVSNSIIVFKISSTMEKYHGNCLVVKIVFIY